MTAELSYVPEGSEYIHTGIMHAASSFASHRSPDQSLLTLCSEVGMGKSTFIDTVLLHEAQAGVKVFHLSLSKPLAESPAERIGRLARDVVRSCSAGNSVAVGVDDVPILADGEVPRVARAIRRMVTAGALVLVAMRPESMDLFNELHEARRLDTAALLGLSLQSRGIFSVSDRALSLTHGVPMLLDAYYNDSGARCGAYSRGGFPGRLAVAARKLALSYTRDTLTNEELCLRLVMILLGRGTFADLAAVLPRFDDDELLWLRDVAPLFRIDLKEEQFEAGPFAEDEILDLCLGTLAIRLKEWQDIVFACVRSLCSQGRYRRADLLSSCLEDESRILSLFELWGPELFLSGNAYVISRAARLVREGERSLTVVGSLTSRIISETNGCYGENLRRRKALETYGTVGGRERGVYDVLCEIEGLRDVEHGLDLSLVDQRLAQLEDGSESQMVANLAKHRYCLGHFLKGEFSAVFVSLLGDDQRRQPQDVCQALLCADFAIAEVMVGDGPTAVERADLDRAREILSDVSPSRWGFYMQTLVAAPRVIFGRETRIMGMEQVDTRANLHGDVLVRLVFQLVEAVGDVKLGAMVRAKMRADRASNLARECGLPYLEEAGIYIATIARICLGNDLDPGVAERQERPSALGDLLRLAIRMHKGETFREVRLGRLPKHEFPSELLWALTLLVGHTGKLGQDVGEQMPAAWVRAERNLAQEEGAWASGRSGSRLPAPEEAGASCESEALVDEPDGLAWHQAQGKGVAEEDKAAGHPSIHLTLLGEFCVEAGGDSIKRTQLARRRACDLLAFLGLAQGHKTTKQAAILAIWGNDDCSNGVQRLYEATSVIRKVLKAKERGIDPVLSSKTEGTIALNMDVIACDVDRFVEEARLTLARDGADRDVISHASRVRRMYAGGPAIRINDPTGATRRWSRALEGLYASALAAGASAALRQGRPYLAEQFAEDAHLVAPRREDIEISLVEAYAQLGRLAEVKSMREKYLMQCAKGTRSPTSELEAVYDDVLDDREAS